MGKERDALIRELGGKPISEMHLSEEQLIELAWETYSKRGELPPTIRMLIEELQNENRFAQPDNRTAKEK